MSLDVDILGELWLTVKEYIPHKDRQVAADHIINVISEHDISERDLKSLCPTDSYYRRAIEDYLGDLGELDNPDD